MFKNKHLQVKVVDDPKPVDAAPRITPDDFRPLVVDTIQNVAAGSAVVAVAFVAADTLRRIAVHIVATKIS